MDSRNLHTASSYINNLLLSRGLLRNGTPIELAEPAKTEGGTDATMAKVMNLVHDLILRRDRESDRLSNLSQTLQAMRAASVQQSEAVTRLETRNADLERQLALSSAQEKTAKATLRTAETRMRALREEMARLKAAVAQIRGQCANDIRRRDGEIARLKRHLEGRRGREGNSGQVGVVVVTPGPTRAQMQSSRDIDGAVDLGSPEYSLKQETTEFLTQLSQGLSDENDALVGLVRNTLATLRSLQGLPLDLQAAKDRYSNIGGSDPLNGMAAAPPSYEELATSTDDVLEHLRGLLTNPSFVPLEEVEVREDEIMRLREGWEKMATRWKEAVAMMDGWRKRMMDTGDTINIDDLTKGMNLAAEIPSVPEDPNMVPEAHAVEQTLDESAGSDWKPRDPSESPSVPQVDDEEIGVLDDEIAQKGQCNVLQDMSANARPVLSPRKVSFRNLPEEEARGNDYEDASLLDFGGSKAVFSPIKSKLPSTQPMPSSPRSVQQKLQQAEAEANEARKRDEKRQKRKSGARTVNKLKGSRRRSTLSPEELENLLGFCEPTTSIS